MNDSKNIEKDFYLEKDDMHFIQYLISEITEDGLLPFSLPPQIFPRIIKNSALWFYEESDDAIIEKWFYIKKSEIPSSDGSRNTTIKLPPNIQSVWEIKPTSDNVYGNMCRFYQEPIIYNAATNALGGTSNLNPYTRANRDIAVENYFASIYEYQLFKTLLGRSFPFDYSPFTNELVLLGNLDGTGLVLKTFTRIPLKNLYSSSRFRKHVIGNCLIKLKRILSQFNFQYPGEVEINFDDLEKDGREMVEKIEEIIKNESDASDLILSK